MEITSSEIIEKTARQLAADGKSWHFHLFTPDCAFNEKHDMHAFVLEDISGEITYVAYSTTRNFELGKKLLELSTGKDSNKKKKGKETRLDPSFESIVAKAASLTEKNIPWHHHVLYPGCHFSKHKTEWCIIFEAPKEGIIEVVYDHEPLEEMGRIEPLFYSQKR